MLLLLSLVALLCCGGALYGGWWQPRQELAEHKRLLEQIGGPRGFQDTRIREHAGTTNAFTEYYLICRDSVCPLDPAGAIYEWLHDNDAAADRNHVKSCLGWASAPDPELCRFTWRGNGWRVDVDAIWKGADGQDAGDREWLLRTTASAD
ncbi:hypothetical protein [Plantactinospora veratri]